MVFQLQSIIDQTCVAEIDFHNQLPSTNDRAIELIKNGNPPLPLLVLTPQQTAGRGQQNRSWISTPNSSLTFSICLTTGTNRSLLPIATALSVSQVIEQVTRLSKIQIKWPNDVFIGNQKICGILIENAQSNQKSVSVIGIGMNVNQNIDLSELQTESDDLVKKIDPTSLLAATGTSHDLNQLLIQVIQHLSINFDQQAQRPESIIEQCNQRLLFFNQPIQFQLPNRSIATGICRGLGLQGELLLESGNQIQSLFSGRIITPIRST